MNYMNQFHTPEEYILHQVSLNKGTQSCITRDKLMRLAEKNQLEISPNAKKREIAESLLKKSWHPVPAF